MSPKPSVPSTAANAPKLYLETFLLCLAMTVLEISYTRVFSYKLVYYFTYLIIGIALLGLGAGGIFVAVFPRVRRVATTWLLPASCLAAAASVAGGYVIVAETQLNAFQLITHDVGISILGEAAKFAVICLAVLTPFFTVGLTLAAIFATQTERIGKLYCVDLLGAGLGCALSVPLAATISPPGAVMLGGLFLALAGMRLARRTSRALLVSLVAAAVALAFGASFSSLLPDPAVDAVKTMASKPGDRAHKIIFSRWSPVFRVDVSAFGDRLWLHHDGQLGSVILRYDGDPASLAGELDTDQRALPFEVLESAPKVIIIGAAGGHEILAALHFGAAHVTGIELNPVTVSLLTTHFADFSGHLAQNPRVTLVNAEGRSFLAGSSERYDLVWFVAPDSYAAMNAATSGAFVLSESYLYTVEMIVDALEHLTDDGIVCAQFGEFNFDRQPNRTTRYLATAREAFRRLGVADFERHVLLSFAPSISSLSESTIILKRAPLTDADVGKFVAGAAKIPAGRAIIAGAMRDGPAPLQKVVSLPDDELREWQGRYQFLVDPVTDDSPFFWHFVRFRDALRKSTEYDTQTVEEGLGELLLLVLLLVAALFAAIFLLVPLVAIRDVWGEIRYKTRTAVYFACLGAGFMFLEVSLIQRFTLLLGYPTYALTVTLCALLVSTGVGSLLTERHLVGHDKVLVVRGGMLLALVLFYEIGLGPLVAHVIGWPLFWRVVLAVVLLAPLGLCLGAFMPLGLRRAAAVTSHREAFVAWSWAVNGFFSVVSSVLATILSMGVGFNVVMIVAAALYVIGIASLTSIPVGGVSTVATRATLPLRHGRS